MKFETIALHGGQTIDQDTLSRAVPVYRTSSYVFKSTDRGDSWTRLGEDLTQAIDRDSLEMMGEIPARDAVSRHQGVAVFSNISSMHVSDLRPGLIVTGSDDGAIAVNPTAVALKTVPSIVTVTTADADGNGALDVVRLADTVDGLLIDASVASRRHNACSSRQSLVAETGGIFRDAHTVGFGDWDGRGGRDLWAVSDHEGALRLTVRWKYGGYSAETSTITSVPTPSDGAWVSTGDYDSDGHLDLFVVDGNRLTVWSVDPDRGSTAILLSTANPMPGASVYFLGDADLDRVVTRDALGELHPRRRERDAPVAEVDQALVLHAVDHLGHRRPRHLEAFGDAGLVFSTLLPKNSNSEDVGHSLRVLYTRPGDAEIFRAQRAAIRNARKYIYIQNAYFTDDAMLYELAKARRRGVDVRVILPLVGNHGPINQSNILAANAMLEHGIRVFVYPGMSHVKAAVYDGWACLGSANWDKLSFRTNKELNIATSHAPYVDALLERVFTPDFAASVEITEPFPVRWSDQLMEIVADYLL